MFEVIHVGVSRFILGADSITIKRLWLDLLKDATQNYITTKNRKGLSPPMNIDTNIMSVGVDRSKSLELKLTDVTSIGSNDNLGLSSAISPTSADYESEPPTPPPKENVSQSTTTKTITNGDSISGAASSPIRETSHDGNTSSSSSSSSKKPTTPGGGPARGRAPLPPIPIAPAPRKSTNNSESVSNTKLEDHVSDRISSQQQQPQPVVLSTGLSANVRSRSNSMNTSAPGVIGITSVYTNSSLPRTQHMNSTGTAPNHMNGNNTNNDNSNNSNGGTNISRTRSNSGGRTSPVNNGFRQRSNSSGTTTISPTGINVSGPPPIPAKSKELLYGSGYKLDTLNSGMKSNHGSRDLLSTNDNVKSSVGSLVASNPFIVQDASANRGKAHFRANTTDVILKSHSFQDPSTSGGITEDLSEESKKITNNPSLLTPNTNNILTKRSNGNLSNSKDNLKKSNDLLNTTTNNNNNSSSSPSSSYVKKSIDALNEDTVPELRFKSNLISESRINSNRPQSALEPSRGPHFIISKDTMPLKKDNNDSNMDTLGPIGREPPRKIAPTVPKGVLDVNEVISHSNSTPIMNAKSGELDSNNDTSRIDSSFFGSGIEETNLLHTDAHKAEFERRKAAFENRVMTGGVVTSVSLPPTRNSVPENEKKIGMSSTGTITTTTINDSNPNPNNSSIGVSEELAGKSEIVTITQ